VTGAVQLQFTLSDPLDSSASPQQIIQKLGVICGANSSPEVDEGDEGEEGLERFESGEIDDEDDETLDDSSAAAPEAAEKKKKRLRLARLKRKAKERGYEFTGSTDIAGVLFVEIQRIEDLPPEKNGMCVIH
jgi:phosphatidylserine decarboxylase